MAVFNLIRCVYDDKHKYAFYKDFLRIGIHKRLSFSIYHKSLDLASATAFFHINQEKKSASDLKTIMILAWFLVPKKLTTLHKTNVFSLVY